MTILLVRTSGENRDGAQTKRDRGGGVMSAAGVPRGHPSAGGATAVKKATAAAKLSVSGPIREDQKQRQTPASAW
jgi:hypothetical protein